MMEYVKMCRVAEEIQLRWEPKSGDLYHYNCAINPLRPLVVSPDVHGFRMEWSGEFFKNCFWVPRQEDLQQIIEDKKGLGIKGVFLLTASFYRYLNKEYEAGAKFDEMVAAWLCFVMETVYNKRWNGTEWEVLL